MVHQNRPLMMEEVVDWAASFASEYQHTVKLISVRPAVAPGVISSWIPPIIGTLKLSTNVIVDIPIEATTLVHGLMLALEIGLNSLIIESDAK
ncbi:hypothetical protein ACOSP7_020862 [Xanthoceras sorbifolium]